MKNKKGITFGRIILYILFAFVIVFIVWSLVLTYRKIKNPNTDVNIECNSSIRYQYNNSYQYSGADYLQRTNLWFYRIPDACNDLNTFYNSNYFDYATVVAPYPYWTVVSQSPGYSWNSDSGVSRSFPFVYWTDSTYSSYAPYVTDNVVDISTSIKNIGNLALTNGVGYPSYPTYANWFNVFSDTAWSGNSQYRGGSLGIEYTCDIPISIFKGSLSGSSLGQSVRMFIVTDNQENMESLPGIGVYRQLQYFDLDSSNNYSFDFNDLVLNTQNVGCSKIKRIFFYVYNSWNLSSNNTTQMNHYLVKAPRMFNYMTSSILNELDISLTFDIYEGSLDYQQGYESGFQAGNDKINSDLSSAYDQLLVDNTELSLKVQALESKIDTLIATNYHLQEVINNSGDFKSLFFTMADVPFKTVHSALGFEFWGINLFRFFTGVLTALGIIWLIKKIL